MSSPEKTIKMQTNWLVPCKGLPCQDALAWHLHNRASAKPSRDASVSGRNSRCQSLHTPGRDFTLCSPVLLGPDLLLPFPELPSWGRSPATSPGWAATSRLASRAARATETLGRTARACLEKEPKGPSRKHSLCEIFLPFSSNASSRQNPREAQLSLDLLILLCEKERGLSALERHREQGRGHESTRRHLALWWGDL